MGVKVSAGGKREGAGRPPVNPLLKKIPSGYKYSQWILDWLREQPEAAGVLLEQALIKQHKLKPPK